MGFTFAPPSLSDRPVDEARKDRNTPVSVKGIVILDNWFNTLFYLVIGASGLYSAYRVGFQASERLHQERIALAVLFHDFPNGLTLSERADHRLNVTLRELEEAPRKLAALPPDAAAQIRDNIDEYIRFALNGR